MIQGENQKTLKWKAYNIRFNKSQYFTATISLISKQNNFEL